jgi:hypothetical protein
MQSTWELELRHTMRRIEFEAFSKMAWLLLWLIVQLSNIHAPRDMPINSSSQWTLHEQKGLVLCSSYANIDKVVICWDPNTWYHTVQLSWILRVRTQYTKYTIYSDPLIPIALPRSLWQRWQMPPAEPSHLDCTYYGSNHYVEECCIQASATTI